MSEKIKAIDPHIVVQNIVKQKIEENTKIIPYYGIAYYDTSDNEWHIGYGSYNIENVIDWLDEYFETVESDVEPVRHGYWIYEELEGNVYRYKCSECGNIYGQSQIEEFKHDKFCGNCGVKMDKLI